MLISHLVLRVSFCCHSCESRNNSFCHFALLFLILHLLPVSITVYNHEDLLWWPFNMVVSMKFVDLPTLNSIRWQFVRRFHTYSLNGLSIIGIVQTPVTNASARLLLSYKSRQWRGMALFDCYVTRCRRQHHDVPLLWTKMCRWYNGQDIASCSILIAATDTIGILIKNRSRDHVYGW